MQVMVPAESCRTDSASSCDAGLNSCAAGLQTEGLGLHGRGKLGEGPEARKPRSVCTRMIFRRGHACSVAKRICSSQHEHGRAASHCVWLATAHVDLDLTN